MNKKWFVANALVWVVSCTAIGCEGCDEMFGYDQRLKIMNNSNGRIYFTGGNTYPDTTIGVYSPANSFAEHGLNPNSWKTFGRQGTWEGTFEDLPADTFMIFIFDADTLEQVAWEKVRSEYKILKRYDVSLQDLKDWDWKVTYP